MPEKIKNAFKNPYKVLSYIVTNIHFIRNNLPDDIYLKIKYRGVFGKKLNLKNPKTFNEKLQWLKLYDRKPIYSTMVDKYEVKKYVADIIGEEYIIPTLGVWNHFDEIDFDSLPDQFVLKCTHDSGGLVIVKDKSKLDINAAKKKIERCLKNNFYYNGREWPYKNVKPRIIAEKYMVDESEYELKDYKLFCFEGFAKAMFIASNRQLEREGTKFDFFDMDFVHLPFTNGHPNSDHDIKRPESFDKMRELSGKLSKGIPHVRVDFYDINGQVYFGELTFAHWSGLVPFVPAYWDDKFGEWIKLPDSIGGGYLIASKGFVLWLHSNFKTELIDCHNGVEKCYKSIKDEGLIDYKFYCFNGEPRYLYVSEGLENHATALISFLTMDWNFAPFSRSDYTPLKKIPDKPSQYDEMIYISKILSHGYAFLRVDLYEINNQVYFSELTFFPSSGFMPFNPIEWDLKIGKELKL